MSQCQAKQEPTHALIATGTDIQKLWDAFWSGGISNPLTAIEQITYLVFLKRLEDLDNLAVRQATRRASIYDQAYSVGGTSYPGDDFRWSNISQRTGDDLFTHMRGPVFEWMKEMDDADQERMRDAVFLIPNVNLLTRAMKTIDGLFVTERNQDTLGDIYENLLKEIAVAGKNGQFRTPRHIIRAMCDLVDPQYGESICDPACGTGGFLVNAYQHILKSHTSPDILHFAADGTPIDAIGDRLTPDQHEALRSNHLHGFDFDRTMVRLGWMNLIQHGLESPDIRYADTLGSIFNERVAEGGDLCESFDIVLANPPFTGSIDKSDVGPTLKPLDSTKTELLFVELILQLLKPGGRAAVIVPEGVLFGSTKAHKALRRKLVEENELRAVISLPGGVFQPYTGVKTSIIVVQKGGRTETVWFYDVAADGESLNAKRTPQPEKNDLWDLVLHYRLRQGMDAPAFVDGDSLAGMAGSGRRDIGQALCPARLCEVEDEDDEGNVVALDVLDSIEQVEIEEAKIWTASSEDLAEADQNLSAGRYQPFSLQSQHLDPPSEIIRELIVEKKKSSRNWQLC